jgi:hypothetical protein
MEVLWFSLTTTDSFILLRMGQFSMHSQLSSIALQVTKHSLREVSVLLEVSQRSHPVSCRDLPPSVGNGFSRSPMRGEGEARNRMSPPPPLAPAFSFSLCFCLASLADKKLDSTLSFSCIWIILCNFILFNYFH